MDILGESYQKYKKKREHKTFGVNDEANNEHLGRGTKNSF